MEFMGLIEELNQGKHLAYQLRNHLHPSLSSSSSSDGILLIDQILRSYENALSVLAGGGSGDEEIPAVAPINADVKDRDVSKKRKVMAKWSEKVKVPCGSTIGAPLDDGFSWRKYGQKDILGSKFPRGYFRCSHRFTQGCLATKQVQKSDNDPPMFEISYRGKHTCNKPLYSNKPKQEQKPLLQQHPMPPKQEQKPLQQQHPMPPQQEQKPLLQQHPMPPQQEQKPLLQQHPMPPQQEQKPLLQQHPMAPKQEQKPLQQQQQHVPLCLTFSWDDVDDSLLRPSCTPLPLSGSEVQDDQSPFRESDLTPTFELNDMLGFWCVGDGDWDIKAGLDSVPSPFTNISMGDLEECCSFENLVESFC